MALPEGLSIGDIVGLRWARKSGRGGSPTARGDSWTIDTAVLLSVCSKKFPRTGSRFPQGHDSWIDFHGNTWTQGSTHVRAVEPTPMRGSSKVVARSEGLGGPLGRMDRRVCKESGLALAEDPPNPRPH